MTDFTPRELKISSAGAGKSIIYLRISQLTARSKRIIHRETYDNFSVLAIQLMNIASPKL